MSLQFKHKLKRLVSYTTFPPSILIKALGLTTCATMAWAMSRVLGQGHRVLMAAAATSAAAAAAKRGRPAGILKVVPVSPALGEFLGVSEVSRTEAVKKVWEYIKQNNLQNPSNKKQIMCDAKLKTIFNGKDQVGFLEIAKLMSQHFTKSS